MSMGDMGMSGPNGPNDDNVNGSMHDAFDDIPDDMVESLKAEKQMAPDETGVELGRRLLNEAVPYAVMGVVKTATHGANEAVRLRAQQYIIDRALGKIG